MHLTEPVYRNPYWPTWPFIQVTQGCTHNSCKFCTMYRAVPFRMQPMEWMEEDLRELQATVPQAKTIQLLSANPLALSFDRLMPRLELIKRYLPHLEHLYAATRVTDIRNKTVEQYKTALEAAKALTGYSQHHEGCIAYDVFQSATRPDVFIICETWADAASLEKHSATQEFKKYSPMMRQCGEMKVERFEFEK